MDLPLDDHRIDDVAAVIDRNEPPDVDLAGSLVDVDDYKGLQYQRLRNRGFALQGNLNQLFHPTSMVLNAL